MFRGHRAHHQERQIVSIQPLVAVTLCRWPCRMQVGSWEGNIRIDCLVCRSICSCTRHGHRHRVTTTGGCIDTICLSWWWARCARNMYRVKNINKYMEKKCASRWSFKKNHLHLFPRLRTRGAKSLSLHVFVAYTGTLICFAIEYVWLSLDACRKTGVFLTESDREMRPEDGMLLNPVLAPISKLSARALTERISVLAGLCGGQSFCAFG